MQSSRYLYNNEALASVTLGYFVKKYGTISVPKLMLVLPFVLHGPTLRCLRNKSNKRSLEELILKNNECFVNFNARFLDFMPLFINTLTILGELNIISIRNNEIHYNMSSLFSPNDFSNLGNRAQEILDALDALIVIMREQDVSSLYLKLKVVL